ncbi:MAG TPA: aspartate-semialdehyde dehydrogenase [Gemmatimonadaceae bacterium]|nr:aspartate-semialdehyde dehydrogenase [Gemmatimonadaceae bacterium]
MSSAASTRVPAREQIPVAVLGATGAVGQTFVRLLHGHPWFRLVALAASERSAGKSYREATRAIFGDLPADVLDMPVLACEPSLVEGTLVFSALDASVARETEQAFARAGRIVLSNAGAHRMDPDVPLVIAEVNPDHLSLLDRQRAERGWPGGIVTNGNCAAIVVALALAPLHERFGVKQLFVSTMQSVSGAGYPGVASLDILGNVIPHIPKEEEKLQEETRKFLGTLRNGSVEPADIRVSAHTNRVAVEHGHTACMSVGFGRAVTPDEAVATLCAWQGAPDARSLPSSPARALIVHSAPDRPQPKRDADIGGGMSVTVGRVRDDPVLHIRLVASGHNTIRGAAGASILNAELMTARGLVPR